MSLQTPKPNTTPLVPGALDGRLALPDLWGIVRARKLDPPPAAVEKRLAVARRSTARAAHAAIRRPRSAVSKGWYWKLEVRRAACEVRTMMLCKPCREPTLRLASNFLRLEADQVSK
ncbi:hypothetical protein [Metallibacterium sp.]|jgi:hypothetical protein|uniref:hypothetical protein n=1 Tax=Metallibacterium sp. TaxID=2940281 RepID=UPI00262FF4CB|nr:hypothetical protein [Metallibacterium sp.]